MNDSPFEEHVELEPPVFDVEHDDKNMSVDVTVKPDAGGTYDTEVDATVKEKI